RIRTDVRIGGGRTRGCGGIPALPGVRGGVGAGRHGGPLRGGTQLRRRAPGLRRPDAGGAAAGGRQRGDGRGARGVLGGGALCRNCGGGRGGRRGGVVGRNRG